MQVEFHSQTVGGVEVFYRVKRHREPIQGRH